jgi:hypothetical protein
MHPSSTGRTCRLSTGRYGFESRWVYQAPFVYWKDNLLLRQEDRGSNPLRCTMLLAVYKIVWIESERGWGQRPDGYSLHASKEEADRYIAEHWAFYEKRYGTKTPDEYSYPDNPELLVVDQATYDEVQEKNSVRRWR